MATSSGQLPARDITVTIPETLLNRLNERMSPQQRSLFIVEAIENRLAIEEQLAAVDEAAGSWTYENHPNMKNPQDIDLWLAELRATWGKTEKDGTPAS